MFFVRIFALFTILFLADFAFAKSKQDNEDKTIHYRINFLPDGTQVKFENDKIYFVCKKKYKPLPTGRYMLADGTVIRVREGKVVSDRQRYQRPTKEKSEKRSKNTDINTQKDKLVPHVKKD